MWYRISQQWIEKFYLIFSHLILHFRFEDPPLARKSYPNFIFPSSAHFLFWWSRLKLVWIFERDRNAFWQHVALQCKVKFAWNSGLQIHEFGAISSRKAIKNYLKADRICKVKVRTKKVLPLFVVPFLGLFYHFRTQTSLGSSLREFEALWRILQFFLPPIPP